MSKNMNQFFIFLIFFSTSYAPSTTLTKLHKEKNKILIETIHSINASEVELKKYYQKKNIKAGDLKSLKKIEGDLKLLKKIMENNLI